MVPAESLAPLVMVVEDDPALRRYIHALMDHRGYLTLLAGDAEYALAVLGGGVEGVDVEGIDAVVTDVVLPGMDGCDLVQQLRERRPDLPALFVSGHEHDVLREMGFNPPPEPCLHKPFKADAFIRALAEALEGAGPAGAAAARR